MLLLFLDFATETEWAAASLGAAAVGAYVRERGHRASLLRIPVDQSLDEAARAVLALAPDCIGLSLACRQWPRAKALAGLLRELSEVPVVAGGLLPTFAPREILAAPGIDYACIGQGEEPAVRLLDALARGERPASGIPGLATREDLSPARPPDLDPGALPFWARDLCGEQNGVAHVGTRRGCPFACTYCAGGALGALHGPAWSRRRPPGHVLAELRAMARCGDLNYVLFVDDTFTLDRDWLAEFLPAYAAQCGLGFAVNARPETLDAALARDLARAGCRHVVLGLESGSERVRREVLGRPMAEAVIRRAAAAVQEAGLSLTLNAMYGLPGETPAEAAATLALAEALGPLDVGHFVFHPYPGTALFEVCRERGLLPADWMARPADHVHPLLDLPEFPAAEVARLYGEWEALRRRLAARRGCEAAGGGV